MIWNKGLKEFVKQDTPNIVIGDKLPVTFNLPQLKLTGQELSEDYGYIIGETVANRDNKVPKYAFVSSDNFLKGLIAGYYDSVGEVINNEIIAKTKSAELVNELVLVFGRIGIFAIIKPNDVIAIVGDEINKFKSLINMKNETKLKQINKISINKTAIERYNDVILDEIINITPIYEEEFKDIYKKFMMCQFLKLVISQQLTEFIV